VLGENILAIGLGAQKKYPLWPKPMTPRMCLLAEGLSFYSAWLIRKNDSKPENSNFAPKKKKTQLKKSSKLLKTFQGESLKHQTTPS
jgi:hypothetical protein